MIALIGSGRRMGPASLLAVAVLVGGFYGVTRDRLTPSEADGGPCDPSVDPGCAGEAAPVTSSFAEEQPTGPVVQASAVCGSAGYLCSDLESRDRIRVRRWKDFSGPMVVYVPAPDFEDRGSARALQRAAGRGIRYWNGQPFPIDVVDRADRGAHFAVRWSRSLGGVQIGVARTQWSPGAGLEVVSLELVTRSPRDPSRLVDPRQVELTAAHEMGHALGLPHSDSPRDVMFPTSTATSLSPQDYRTMQALYRLADGTEVVR